MNMNEGARPHILSTEDPLWPTQQAFMEVAHRSGETNPNKLYLLAIEDYRRVFRKLPPRLIQRLFRKWSKIHAEINSTPYMQYLVRMGEAEIQGDEALAEFLANNPEPELGD